MPNSQLITHSLQGLRPQPLASYLSALGVLRLVHRVDPNVGGAWRDGAFVLEAALDKEELLNYFLEEYQPTPITSPWNGGSGYFGNDNKDGFNAILETDNPRFAPYRQTLERINTHLAEQGITAKPSDEGEKSALLRDLRAILDDEALLWLDAATVQGEDSSGRAKVRYAPLLGTGGNDGRLEFSNNLMQRLQELFLSPKAKANENRELLETALFGTVGRFLRKSPVGQFDPGSAGGVNLSVGFEGSALVNPWYYILMMEGSLVLTAAAVSRFRDSSRTGGAFPFTVNHQGAGNGKLGQEEGNRNEIWLPLWDSMTGYPEVRALFAEGRAQIGRQQARNPIEFSLALASHGTSRGINGFSRFGFLQRNGKSFFATGLGYQPVEERQGASLLRQVESWMRTARSVLKTTGGGLRTARRYDNAAMDYLSTNRSRGLTLALERLGEVHQYLCRTPKLWDNVRPLPELDNDWATLADDNSPEFYLALSTASLFSEVRAAETLRSQLTPYNPLLRNWNDSGWIPRWTGRDVADRMVSLLRHRLRDGQSPFPLRGSFFAPPTSIERFLDRTFDDGRFERLLYGLCLLRKIDRESPRSDNPTFLPLPYLLARLAVHQGPGLTIGDDGKITMSRDDRDERRAPSSIPTKLATGNLEGALRDSRRFLFGRSVVIPSQFTSKQKLPVGESRRLAAALLVPISDRTYLNYYKRLVSTDI